MLWACGPAVLRVPDATTAVKDAMAAPAFPVVLMDTGDTSAADSTGDGTFILQELIARRPRGGWLSSPIPKRTRTHSVQEWAVRSTSRSGARPTGCTATLDQSSGA